MARAKKREEATSSEENTATEHGTAETQTVEAGDAKSLTEDFVTEVVAQATNDGQLDGEHPTSATEELPPEEPENSTEPTVAPVDKPRSDKPVYVGKYAGAHAKLNGEIPTDFKYLNVELFPGHAPKGYLRAMEPPKPGAKVRSKSVMTIVYEIAKKHYDETGTGIKGRELIYAMSEHDWRGTNSPYCEGGTPTYVWIKDYIIGAARPNAQHLMLKESDVPRPKAAPAALDVNLQSAPHDDLEWPRHVN